MDTIDALLGRNSSARLQEPAPAGQALQNIFRAALRAPDHARLTPWRFAVIEGDARHKLGELFVRAALVKNRALDELAISKLRSKPLRAPLIIVVAVRLQSHSKVPEIEQFLSAGAAAHAMLLAAHAQGFAGIWRTGSMARDDTVHAGLGFADHENIVGFLYLGARDGQAKPLPEYQPEDYFRYWS